MAHSKLTIPLTPESIPDLLEECIKASHIKESSFTQVYPNAPVTLPTVVWKVERRVPGKEGKETKGPRMRGGVVTLNTTTLVDHAVQWNTIIYQFDLFHATNEKVNELVNDFESFIFESLPALKTIGIESFSFYEQLEDYSIAGVPKEIPHRSLRYEATFSVYRPVYIPRIRQILRLIKVSCLGDLTEDTHQLQVTRTSEEYDLVNIPFPAITSVADASGAPEPDYIAGVDYELSATEDGRGTQIIWTHAGKRPVTDATYYVTYSDIDAFSYQTII